MWQGKRKKKIDYVFCGYPRIYMADLSGPPRVSLEGVVLEQIFECGFMAADDAYG